MARMLGMTVNVFAKSLSAIPSLLADKRPILHSHAEKDAQNVQD
jgi:hypothetical protein